MDIEEINACLTTLPRATGITWHVAPIAPGRLYASRAPDGGAALLIVGAAGTFGALSASNALSYSDRLVALPENEEFAGLRIVGSDPVHGQRAIAHLLYEAARLTASEPTITNQQLLMALSWLLPLVDESTPLLSPERQRGLVGECLLLRQLLVHCASLALPPGTALQRWWGASGGKRDFAAAGIAVEAKATAHKTRRHHIGDLEQLEPQDGEERVYLYSVGIRTDPSAPRKLGRYVDDIIALLRMPDGTPDDQAVADYRRRLLSIGLDWERLGEYDTQPGYLPPHLPPALFRVADLDRLRLASFVDGKLPSMVVGVSYDLEVLADPVGASEERDVLQSLLAAPALGVES